MQQTAFDDCGNSSLVPGNALVFVGRQSGGSPTVAEVSRLPESEPRCQRSDRAATVPSARSLVSFVLLCALLFPMAVVGRRDTHSSSSISRRGGGMHHQLSRQYLPRGLQGVVQCPIGPEPPHRMIVWVKDDRVLSIEDAVVDYDDDDGDADDDEDWIDGEGEDDVKDTLSTNENEEDEEEEVALEERMTIDKDGLLLIDEVTWSDEGVYKCTSYSPVDGNGETYTIGVFVRGTKALLNHFRNEVF